MLGQEGGCVSVLRWDSGHLLYRAPAHSSQTVSALQADPGNDYLISAGEDRTIQVWRVCPLSPDFLSPHFSLSCGQPAVHLATLGPLLGLALQEHHSAPYCLLHVCLETQSPTEHLPSQGHLDCITGLCACPQMGVLASSSQDGTIRIWDDENRLLRILQLQVGPECLAYCGQRGELLLGIRGDLYRIPKTHLLPPDHHVQLLCAEQFDPIPGLPISESRSNTSTHSIRCGSCYGEEEEKFSQEERTTDVHSALLARSRDLQALQQGLALGAKKKKLPPPRGRKREAFARYLQLVFPEPLKIQIPTEDQQGVLFPPRRPSELRPLTPDRGGPTSASDQRSLLGHIPNSVLLARLWPDMMARYAPPQKPWALRGLKLLVFDDDDDEDDDDGECDEDELKLRQRLEDPPRKAPTPPKPPCPIPEFLSPFVEQDWFQEVLPDHSLLDSSFSAEVFALLLVQKLKGCQTGSRTHILNALLQLLQQGALTNTKQICSGLTELLETFATSDMLEDMRFVCELLKALASVGSDSTDTILELLTILAQRELGLQGVVLRLLRLMGVEEAEPWLSSEVATWRSGMQGEPGQTWAHLRQVAANWLNFWTCKYKQDRALPLKGAEKSPVDVLRFFCSRQRENQRRPPPLPPPPPLAPPPEGRRDTVLLEQHLHR
ncbi:WD repeat-containing protein 97 [Conger conger]|uniref:WD repeat-containing protein 97 n=1 Tax=Conger conger TaxID=82655 RepID=UPI002A5A9BF8|nr:WD repeat-containing protein 97 [Conger conger]